MKLLSGLMNPNDGILNKEYLLLMALSTVLDLSMGHCSPFIVSRPKMARISILEKVIMV